MRTLLIITALFLSGCFGLQRYTPMNKMTTEELHAEFKAWERKFIQGPYFTKIQLEKDIMRHAGLGMELSRRGYWTTPSSFSYDRVVP